MPAIPSTSLTPVAFSSLSAPLAPHVPVASASLPAHAGLADAVSLAGDLQTAATLPGGAPASWRCGDADNVPAAATRTASRVPRSVYDHPLVQRTMTNLFYEMEAANERGDAPLSNPVLLDRLLAMAPEDGIKPASIPRLFDFRLPSLLLTEQGFEPGTMKALYYNLGKLRSLPYREATTRQYVEEGKAWLGDLIARRPEFLVSELSHQMRMAVMLHAKANHASALDNWADSNGYDSHVAAVNAVAADYNNHLAGTPTVVEAAIEARRVAEDFNPIEEALMQLMNVADTLPSLAGDEEHDDQMR